MKFILGNILLFVFRIIFLFSLSDASLYEGTVRPIIHYDGVLNLKPKTLRGEGDTFRI